MISLFNAIMLLTPATGSGESGSQSIWPTLLTFGVVFLVFYFLIIRPQSKRQKETKQMLTNLQKGDKVVTAGGIRGVVQSIKDNDDTVVLKVATDTNVEFSRSSIASVTKSGGSGAESSTKITKKDESSKTTASDTPKFGPQEKDKK